MEEKNVDCYIVNTGDFMGKKVQPKDTLGILEAIVEGKAEFKQWGELLKTLRSWNGKICSDLNDEVQGTVKECNAESCQCSRRICRKQRRIRQTSGGSIGSTEKTGSRNLDIAS